MKLNRRKVNKDYHEPFVAHGNIVIGNLRTQGISVIDPSRHAKIIPYTDTANESVTLTTHTGNGEKRERRELRPAKQGGFQQICKRIVSYFRNG